MCPCEFGAKDGKKPLQFEFALNAFRYNEKLINFYSLKPVYHSAAPSGFTFKYHREKLSLRAAFDYAEDAYTYSFSDTMNYNKNTGKSFHKEFRLGVEKTFNSGILQYYAGADMFAAYGVYNGMSEGYGDTIPSYNMNYRFRTSTYGVSPFIGLRFRPIRRFSVSLETALSIGYYKTKNNTPAYSNEQNVSVLFIPVRAFSINYHFSL
jgi:hypothetical protein